MPGQLAKANALVEREGLTPFVSVQSHYNPIMREDERELFGLCTEDNIAMTPYSALASGRSLVKKAIHGEPQRMTMRVENMTARLNRIAALLSV